MIDLHAHILPGLDDGAGSLEESVEMCRISYKDGIRTILATPHILPGVYENSRSAILSKTQELNAAIIKCARLDEPSARQAGLDELASRRSRGTSARQGLQDADWAMKNLDSGMSSNLSTELRKHHSELPLVILPGADVHFSPDLLQICKKGEIVTVNDRGQYLMIEFGSQGIPYRAEDVLFGLMTRGIIPIITHPERNLEIEQRPQRYAEMIRRGCLGQVTAMSLTGGFGPGVKQNAEKLLKNRLVHIIASDAHSMARRPPILSTAVREAEKIVGKEEARRMVIDCPQAVIEGRRPDVAEPIPI